MKLILLDWKGNQYCTQAVRTAISLWNVLIHAAGGAPFAQTFYHTSGTRMKVLKTFDCIFECEMVYYRDLF